MNLKIVPQSRIEEHHSSVRSTYEKQFESPKSRTKEHLENITDRRDLDVTFEGLIILAKQRIWRGSLKGRERSIHFTIRTLFKYHCPKLGNHRVHECPEGEEGENVLPSRGCQNLSTARWKIECAENTALLYDKGGTFARRWDILSKRRTTATFS